MPDDDNKRGVEVGALWAHDKGGGFSITLKPGIALALHDGARLVAFRINEEREAERREQRARDNRAASDRGYNRSQGRR